ncbi:MAG: RidA family protein, partial [Bacteroidales bacterium]|nr:RidA family protein [Bacteroidales bacterium]
RTNLSTGAKWEDIVGYSRAVKIGNLIAVSGTTAVDENNNIIGKNDPYLQTLFIFQKIEKALKQLGATMDNVIRTRMFVTNINSWEEIGKAHGEFFKNIKPAATMLEVSKLIDPELLVEIEVDAVIE